MENGIIKIWTDKNDRGFLRAAGLAIAIIFVFSTVSAPFAEANFWKERRAAAEQKHPSQSPLPESASPTQFARLPASLQGMPEISTFGPDIDQLRGIPGQVFTSGNGASLGEDEIQNSLNRMPDSLKRVPSAYGMIRRVHLAADRKAPLVVLVQDAHEVESAQRNIVELLRHLHEDRESLLVGIEGASGAFLIPDFRKEMDDRTARGLAADVMLQKSFISGADFYGLTAEKEPVLWGVENEDLYMEHVNAYRASQRAAADLDQYIGALTARVRPLKEKFYSKELLEYDGLLADDGAGKMTALLDYFARQDRVSLKGYPQATLLARALDLEKSLDFKQVEKERGALIQVLGRNLSKGDLDALAQASLAYRAGQLGHAGYYGYLKGLLAKNVKDAAAHKEFYRYMDYVLLTGRVDAGRLFDELETLKEKVLDSLVETPEQRSLARASEDLRRLAKLSRFELNPREWDRFRMDRPAVLALDETLGKLESNTVPAAASVPLNEILNGFEGFYTAALKRNNVLVDNLLKKMNVDQPQPFAVLIAGGFHTPGVEKEFAERGISVVTVMPRIGTVDAATKYLDFFSESGTPIEKMLLGDKLMVAPTSPFAQKINAAFAPFKSAALLAQVQFYIGFHRFLNKAMKHSADDFTQGLVALLGEQNVIVGSPALVGNTLKTQITAKVGTHNKVFDLFVTPADDGESHQSALALTGVRDGLGLMTAEVKFEDARVLTTIVSHQPSAWAKVKLNLGRFKIPAKILQFRLSPSLKMYALTFLLAAFSPFVMAFSGAVGFPTTILVLMAVIVATATFILMGFKDRFISVLPLGVGSVIGSIGLFYKWLPGVVSSTDLFAFATVGGWIFVLAFIFLFALDQIYTWSGMKIKPGAKLANDGSPAIDESIRLVFQDVVESINNESLRSKRDKRTALLLGLVALAVFAVVAGFADHYLNLALSLNFKTLGELNGVFHPGSGPSAALILPMVNWRQLKGLPARILTFFKSRNISPSLPLVAAASIVGVVAIAAGAMGVLPSYPYYFVFVGLLFLTIAAAVVLMNKMNITPQAAAVLADIREAVENAIAPRAMFIKEDPELVRLRNLQKLPQAKTPKVKKVGGSLNKDGSFLVGPQGSYDRMHIIGAIGAVLVVCLVCALLGFAAYAGYLSVLLNKEWLPAFVVTLAASIGMAYFWSYLTKKMNMDAVWMDLPLVLGLLLFFVVSNTATLPFFISLSYLPVAFFLLSFGAVLFKSLLSRNGVERKLAPTYFWLGRTKILNLSADDEDTEENSKQGIENEKTKESNEWYRKKNKYLPQTPLLLILSVTFWYFSTTVLFTAFGFFPFIYPLVSAGQGYAIFTLVAILVGFVMLYRRMDLHMRVQNAAKEETHAEFIEKIKEPLTTPYKRLNWATAIIYVGGFIVLVGIKNIVSVGHLIDFLFATQDTGLMITSGIAYIQTALDVTKGWLISLPLGYWAWNVYNTFVMEQYGGKQIIMSRDFPGEEHQNHGPNFKPKEDLLHHAPFWGGLILFVFHKLHFYGQLWGAPSLTFTAMSAFLLVIFIFRVVQEKDYKLTSKAEKIAEWLGKNLHSRYLTQHARALGWKTAIIWFVYSVEVLFFSFFFNLMAQNVFDLVGLVYTMAAFFFGVMVSPRQWYEDTRSRFGTALGVFFAGIMLFTVELARNIWEPVLIILAFTYAIKFVNRFMLRPLGRIFGEGGSSGMKVAVPAAIFISAHIPAGAALIGPVGVTIANMIGLLGTVLWFASEKVWVNAVFGPLARSAFGQWVSKVIFHPAEPLATVDLTRKPDQAALIAPVRRGLVESTLEWGLNGGSLRRQTALSLARNYAQLMEWRGVEKADASDLTAAEVQAMMAQLEMGKVNPKLLEPSQTALLLSVLKQMDVQVRQRSDPKSPWSLATVMAAWNERPAADVLRKSVEGFFILPVEAITTASAENHDIRTALAIAVRRYQAQAVASNAKNPFVLVVQGPLPSENLESLVGAFIRTVMGSEESVPQNLEMIHAEGKISLETVNQKLKDRRNPELSPTPLIVGNSTNVDAGKYKPRYIPYSIAAALDKAIRLMMLVAQYA